MLRTRKFGNVRAGRRKVALVVDDLPSFRTLATEWAYRQAFASNAERAAALAPWIEHYNTRRRHSVLGGLPPISRLAPT